MHSVHVRSCGMGIQLNLLKNFSSSHGLRKNILKLEALTLNGTCLAAAVASPYRQAIQ